MGLLLAIARKAQLKSELFMYEHKMVLISRAKSDLALKISDYEMIRSNYDPNSPEMKTFNQRIERLNQVDKRLDEQYNKLQTQIQLKEAEYNSCEEMFKSNLQRMYGH